MWPWKKKEPKKEVAQKTAGGEIIGGFVPLINFPCEVTGTYYITGQRYHLRRRNTALEARVANWISEGKVTRV